MGETKMMLARICIVCVFAATTCNAATYFVGDGSGWDISTDLDSWTLGKTFNVGDILIFQYSSPHSVYEVTRDGFQSCNTTKPLQTFSTGNTTVALSEPRKRFFVCGNKLHCFAGMRLQVDVHGNATSPAPAGAPRPAVAGVLQPSSKSNYPATVVPSSGAGGGRDIKGFLFSMVFFSLSLSPFLIWCSEVE